MQLTRRESKKMARDLVGKMTLEEKIGQVNFRAPAIPRLNIPEYNYWNEGLHGVARAGVATVFPQAIALSAMFDERLLNEVAGVISEEGRAKYNQFIRFNDRDIYKGLTYWSPNINIFRDPRWGRGQETYGEDPYLTSRLGVAFIRGMQGKSKYLKVAACAKHFAVHSGPEESRHYFNAKVSLKDLYETYLVAFEAAVKEGDVESIMGAYNAVNGVPSCVNEFLLNDILRKDWLFEGHVVSDYAALEDTHSSYKYTNDEAETMALAMKRGCHLCAGNISHHLHEAIERGIVQESEIESSVVSLFSTRIRLGMFAEDCDYDQIPYSKNDSKNHQNLAIEVAKKSFVLLKNDGILPLNLDEIQSIAVIGPNADSKKVLEGNYFGTSSRNVTILQGIQKYSDSIRINYAIGCHLFKDNVESTLSKINERETEALIAAEHSDLSILCLGLDPSIEGEQGDSGNVYGSGDKVDLTLPGKQLNLLEKVLNIGKPVVLLLSTGSALTLNGLESHPNLKAIMNIWYPGGDGGTAVSEVLFGETSPSGKLPVTFYKSLEGLPDFEDYSMAGRTYRYMNGEALYPFGFGLTYSEVQVKNLNISFQKDTSIKVNVDIKNIGNRDTDEVIQVYVKDLDSINAVKNYSLRGFKRISLRKDEKKNIDIVLSPRSFESVDCQGNRVVDGENFIIYVGVSQPDKRSQELLNVAPLSRKINYKKMLESIK